MIFSDSVYRQIKEAISKDIEIDLRAFIKNLLVYKWMVSADFVTCGEERVNDTFAFTLFPCKLDFKEMQKEIKDICPSDIKKIKVVSEGMLKFLSSKERFHFCFIPNRDRHKFGSLDDARLAIDEALRDVGAWNDHPQKFRLLKKLRVLRQKAKAHAFNFVLLHNLTLLAVIAAVISCLIIKHSRPESILWLIDRDNMMTAYDNIAIDFINMNLSSACIIEGINQSGIVLESATDDAAFNGRHAWFDDFVRIPDYIAGAMSRWNIHSNYVITKHEKFMQVINHAISENPHVAILTIDFALFWINTSVVRVYNIEKPNKMRISIKSAIS